ncbi:MAG TPA: hypothetical protein VGH87_04115 [Polyangiaceae bacterium]
MIRNVVLISAVALVATWSARVQAQACKTRDDCQAGYKCVWNYCVAEREDQTNDVWARKAQGESAPSNVKTFIGLTLAAGVLSGGYTSSQPTLWGKGLDSTVLFALRGGVLLGRVELALEIAPFTQFWDLQRASGPAFDANATVGYRIPFARVAGVLLEWPLRVGLGIFAGGDNTGDDVFAEARLDPIGVAFQSGPLMVDFVAPSIRYALTNGHVPGIAASGVTTHYISLFFGSSVSYAF